MINSQNYKYIISIDNVQISFKDINVLDGVSLNIKKGEIYTLLGENGSGKTTLIKIMTTLLKQNSGNVMISGYDVKKNPEKIRENISLNAQSTTVDELFSGYENMSLIAQLRGVKNPKEEIGKLSKRFDLSDFLMRKVATYSGGMRRRLDIAMSLMGDPEIIQ